MFEEGNRVMGHDPSRTRWHRHYPEVGTRIELDMRNVGAPSKDKALGLAYNGNRQYRDLRAATWHQAGRALQLEEAILNRLEGVQTPERLKRLVSRLDRWSDMTAGLDLFTASTVFSLAAASGIPFSSCNGGALGDAHFEDNPTVAFWWPSRSRRGLAALRESAEEAGIAIYRLRVQRVGFSADAEYVFLLPLFARALLARRAEFTPQLPSAPHTTRLRIKSDRHALRPTRGRQVAPRATT